MSRRPKPANIVDVANLAGVSPATVSRCYTTPDIVRGDTRRRILDAAESLGYIRNRQASALHGGASGAVGLVVPTVDNAIFAELIQAFARRLLDSGVTLLVSPHGYDLDLETLLVRAMLEHRADGVALIGLEHNAATYALLERRGVPAVTLWNHRRNAAVSCIGPSNRAAGRLVVRHLAELGHRDPVFLFPETASNDRAGDRLAGALDAARKAGIGDPRSRVVACPYDIAAAKRIAGDILARPVRPGAMVCGNDIIARGVYYACAAAGLAIPKDVSVTGIGDFAGSAEAEPGLTTVRIPAERIGTIAADEILEAISGNRTGAPTRIEIGADLVVRGSTGPPARR